MLESRQLILGNGRLSISFHMPLFTLDESCVKYYHILDLLYVCISAKNSKETPHPNIWVQNQKQNKNLKDLGGAVWLLGFFHLKATINLSFCIFKRWSFSALKFRERVLKGTYSSAKAGVPIQIKEHVLYSMAYLITEAHASDRNPAE